MGRPNPAYIGSKEPLRQLAAMLNNHPLHFLTTHVLTVLHYSLRWCENTSQIFRSPISGKADGIAPEGVLFPRISLEFHPFKTRHDTPQEWRSPLVKDNNAGPDREGDAA
jgi:hypothetical protein